MLAVLRSIDTAYQAVRVLTRLTLLRSCGRQHNSLAAGTVIHAYSFIQQIPISAFSASFKSRAELAVPYSTYQACFLKQIEPIFARKTLRFLALVALRLRAGDCNTSLSLVHLEAL